MRVAKREQKSLSPILIFWTAVEKRCLVPSLQWVVPTGGSVLMPKDYCVIHFPQTFPAPFFSPSLFLRLKSQSEAVPHHCVVEGKRTCFVWRSGPELSLPGKEQWFGTGQAFWKPRGCWAAREETSQQRLEIHHTCASKAPGHHFLSQEARPSHVFPTCSALCWSSEARGPKMRCFQSLPQLSCWG